MNSTLSEFVKSEILLNRVNQFSNVMCISQEMDSYIDSWDCWYKGYCSSFHDYYMYNGVKNVKLKRRTLNMGKKVSEDKANLLMNENVKILYGDANTEKIVKYILEDNNFRELSNVLVEKTQALGSGAYVTFLNEYGDIKIDYLGAKNIIPLRVVNGIVESCAFFSEVYENGQSYVYLNAHIRLRPLLDITKESPEVISRLESNIPLDYDGYIIYNYSLTINEKTKSYEQTDSSIANIPILTNSTVPFFQVMKTSGNNNKIDIENGMGMSVFAMAIDQLESVDLIYDSFINEFKLGKKRIFINDKMAKISKGVNSLGQNTFTQSFDFNDVEFYATDSEQQKDMIKTVDPLLRVEEHNQALNSALNLLGFQCGMGKNFYRFENGVLKTATEIISSNKDLYNSIRKDQHVLRRSVIGLIRALIVLVNNKYDTNFDVFQSINVSFDDSIFQDKDTIKEMAFKEYDKGLISKVDYYMTVYDMTHEDAVNKVAEVNKYNSL